MGLFQIEKYHFFRGKKEQSLQLFIPVDRLPLEEADEDVRRLSDALEARLPREWKCFPDSTLPECCNIITLPSGAYLP